MNYYVGPENSYKINSILMSYQSVLNRSSYYPELREVQQEMRNHFLQEFSLDVNIYQRFETYGASDENHFLELLKDGVYDNLSPTIDETLYLIQSLSLSFVDYEGFLINPALQEVW